VEGRKMHGHIRTQFFHNPLGHFIDFLVRIVLAGYQQGCQLKPYVGFMLEVFQGFQNRRQMRTGDLVIEVFGKCLQVNNRRIPYRTLAAG